MKPSHAIPSFAFVGHPNEGKSTVMATLAEDDQAAISEIPGTTLTAKRYPLFIDDVEVLTFFDTPGFENPAETLDWFQKHKDLPDPVAEFLATFKNSPEFRQECEILKPLSEGAAAIFVVDGSRPDQPIDRQEIEILRLCAVPRIGVINSKEEHGTYIKDWKRLMARDFNHIHEFNGHRATFRDRIKLLEAARAVIQEWDQPMKGSIQAIREDWDGRLTTVARFIIEDIEAWVNLRAHETIQCPGDESRAKKSAEEALKAKVVALENKFRTRTRKLFRHSDERWLTGVLTLDPFHEEVWRLLGLSKLQLTGATAATGAAIGAFIDAHVGGASFGLGTAIGAAAGATAGWVGADMAVDISIPGIQLGPFSIGGGKLGGRTAEARLATNSNTIWLLMDRYLGYADQCAAWSHGKRQTLVSGEQKDSAKEGFTTAWSKDEKKKVSNFIGALEKSSKDASKVENAQRELKAFLVAFLQKLTT